MEFQDTKHSLERVEIGRLAPEHLRSFTNYPRTLRMIWEGMQSGRSCPIGTRFRATAYMNLNAPIK